MPLDFSCTDWADRLKAGLPPMPVLPLDEDLAADAAWYFDSFRIPDVAGQPLLEDAAGDWFREIVRRAIGAIDPETGAPAVGEVFCLVPKKNGKTTYTAALGLTALVMNKTPGVEMMIVAATQEIANTCLKQAADMIRADRPDEEGADPYLLFRFDIQEHKSRIVDRSNGASLSIKTFSMKIVTGKIPVLTIVDELHLLGTTAQADRILTQLRQNMITRDNSLLVFISTQSDEPPAGVFKTELDYARSVRDGETFDEVNTLVCIYEFPEAWQIDENRPWADPETWYMVQPNLGRSVKLDRLKREYRKAEDKGKEAFRLWASQMLNIQIGLALHGTRWIGVDYWPKPVEDLDLEAILTRCAVAVAGIDLGGLDDLASISVIGLERATGDWLAWSRAWAHKPVFERRKDIAPRLLGFVADGDLIKCDRAGQDLDEMVEICARLLEAGILPATNAIGIDPYSAEGLKQALAAAGITEAMIEMVPQGVKLSPAIWDLERILMLERFRHGGQPLLDWCLSNAKVEQIGDAVAMRKSTNGKAKIDPLIALVMAGKLMSRGPVAAVPLVSPWDDPKFSLVKGAA